MNDFYEVYTEQVNRTFDLITRHNFKTHFDKEANRMASGQTASKEN